MYLDIHLSPLVGVFLPLLILWTLLLIIEHFIRNNFARKGVIIIYAIYIWTIVIFIVVIGIKTTKTRTII